MVAAKKRGAAIFALLINAIAFIAAIALHSDALIDRLLGLGPAVILADRFDNSYGSRDKGPDLIQRGNPAWSPTIALFERYGKSHIDYTQVNYMLRSVAVASSEIPGQTGSAPIAQWTAPSTPIYVYTGILVGNHFVGGKQSIVGTIGEFHEWIQRRREDFRFLVTDIIIAGIALANSIILIFVRS